MGIKIKPSPYCRSLHLEYPHSGPYVSCKDDCRCGVYWSMTEELSCLEGAGTCYYTCTTGYCEEQAPETFMCHSFWHLTGYTCNVDPGSEPDHAFDLTRKVWFDYGMADDEAVFMDRWQREDQKLVLRYGNKSIGGRIHILIDPKFFLPCHVEGDLDPDATGTYSAEGSFSDNRICVDLKHEFFLWWDDIDSWIINEQVGYADGLYWKRTDPSSFGNYDPFGGAVGVAAVLRGEE